MNKPAVRFLVGSIVALVLAFQAGLPATQAHATGIIIRVATYGSTLFGCGGTWEGACKLQYALQIRATNGDELWVAEGLYKPAAAQTDTFLIPSGVAVYGGFVGMESLRTQRNWNTNITVLSGDIDNNDTTDVDGVVQDYTDIVGGNSYHVVSMGSSGVNPITATTVLDGFTVTAGKANGPGENQYHGGGLFCQGSYSRTCSPTLANITFVGNYAEYGGGAIYNLGSKWARAAPASRMQNLLATMLTSTAGQSSIVGSTAGQAARPCCVSLSITTAP
jgi:predicted outer membrane repeat protein